MVPTYSGVSGPRGLPAETSYVLANIRGGGEFGPAWHKAAMKENHIRNFEDFSAVARVSSPARSPRPATSASSGGLRAGSSSAARSRCIPTSCTPSV